MQSSHEVNSASAYFNENWQRYQLTVQSNTLYHREMLAALQQFLRTHFNTRPFSFVDVGCGDSSTVAPILAGTSISQYIGIDAAKDVLHMALNSLAALHCEKEFITDDMTTAIMQIPNSVDIIYTSYAVHHLSFQAKAEFIQHCQQKLNPGGFLLMIDGVLEPKQTRQEWLDALQARMQVSIPDISADELAFRMQHPTADDFPEPVDAFSQIAQQQGWKSFQVIVDKGIFAFMVFAN